MTFFDAIRAIETELTPDELLEISCEISDRYAPVRASVEDEIENDGPERCGSTTATNSRLLHSRFDDRIGLSALELQDISRELSAWFNPEAPQQLKPELCLLPVDPDHLYAYWDLGGHLPISVRTRPPDELILRVYWQPNASVKSQISNVWFDLKVNPADARQKVRLPIDDSAYSAALGSFKPEQGFAPYVHSNLIRVPPSGRKLLLRQRPVGVTQEAALAVQPSARLAVELPAESRELPRIEPYLNILQLMDDGWYVKFHTHNQMAYELVNAFGANVNQQLSALLNERGVDFELVRELSRPDSRSRTVSGLSFHSGQHR